MTEIAIVYSKFLLDNEGSESSAFKHSTHSTDIEAAEQTLSALDFPYRRWEESELQNTEALSKHSVRIFIVPGMRVCSDHTLQRLIALAENGSIILASLDSFYYARNSKGVERVIEPRIRSLFQLSNDSYIRSRLLGRGFLRFFSTRHDWLTKGLPSQLDYSEKYALAVLGSSSTLATHAEVKPVDQIMYEGAVDEKLKSKPLPAFLIREFPSGGLFIYAAFVLRHTNDIHIALLKNLWARMNSPLNGQNNQVRALKLVIVGMAGFIGLLLAIVLLGPDWTTSIGGAILGIIVGYLGGKITDIANRWISDSKR